MKLSYLLAFVPIIFLGSCGSSNNQTLFSTASSVNIETLKDVYVVNDQGPNDLYYRIKEGDVIAIRNLQNKYWGSNRSMGTSTGSQNNTAATNTIDPNAISYIVDDDGMVTLPAIKDKVKVAGLTRLQARQKVEDLYDTDNLADPIIELNVVNLKVYLFGEFAKQGNFFLTKDNTTLIEILSEAGGLLKTADPRSLIIKRGKETIYVNLTSDAVIGNRKLVLQNNDVITIAANKTAKDGEKIQRFNNVIQPILVIVNLIILAFTLSK
ncbi:MAG: polysaccharide biosynthesis/export family protein [Pedobacter sp.]|nr:polysaccharide biosynthesis/export family protein [Pedobacter sp.]